MHILTLFSRNLIFSSLMISLNSIVKYLCIHFMMEGCQLVCLICSRNQFRQEQITLLQNFVKNLVYINFQPIFYQNCGIHQKMTLKFLNQNPHLKIHCIQIVFYLIKLDCQLNRSCPKPYCSKTKSIHYFNLLHSVSVFKESVTTMHSIWYISSLNSTV